MADKQGRYFFSDTRFRAALRIALVFLLVSYIYLYGSDWVVEAIVPIEWQFLVNLSKGFVYVTITAIGLVYFINRALVETHAAETQFRLLFEAGGDGILVTKPGGEIVAANRAAEMATGWSREELVGPGNIGRLNAIAPEIIAAANAHPQHRPMRQRFTIHKKSGDVIPVFVSVTTFRLPNGEMRICAILHDLTETEKHEEKYREGERLRLVGHLSGGVAHDFNNLLTVISGNTEILLDLAEPDTPQQRAANIIWMASQQAAQLIRHLLAFARRQSLEPAAFSVSQRLRELMPLLSKAVGSNVEVELRCEDNVWLAYADVAQFENAVLNLVLNAKDALTDNPKVIVEAINVMVGNRSEFEDALVPGDYVALSVTDHGCGMNEEVRSRAVEPFFSTKDAGHGIGLGLSTVFGFAKQSGGHLDIRSEPDNGTTMTIFLPRPLGGGADAADKRDAREIVGGKESILVVEDDSLVRVFLDNALSQLGYKVVSVGDALEAMTLLGSSAPIDLLLADVVLPRGMNGRELAQSLKETHPDMAVLFISGFPDEQATGEDGTQSPALKKPFQVQDLAKRIRETLEERRRSGATS